MMRRSFVVAIRVASSHNRVGSSSGAVAHSLAAVRGVSACRPPLPFTLSPNPGGGTARQLSQHSQQKRQLKRKKQKQEDPFKVLGLSKDTDYNTVKKTFLKIAMAHHPDTSKAETEEEREKHRDVFVAARRAFENIVEGPDGTAVIRSDQDETWDDEELNEWFHQESGGFDMPFMDIKTRREVSRVMDEIGGGLDRDGGMWTLARMVANDVKNGGDGASLLRLEAGNVRDREINGILRRRRRR